MVSEYTRQGWRVKTFSDMNDFASHPSAILSDGAYSVFVKLSEAAHGLDQFEVELAGLRLLSERAGILTPPAIGIAPVEGGVILVLEAVQAVERKPSQWREIGRTLARIHQVRGEQYGLEMQGYFGPLYQDNRPMPDWLSFYSERRLWPRLMGAINSGNLPTRYHPPGRKADCAPARAGYPANAAHTFTRGCPAKQLYQHRRRGAGRRSGRLLRQPRNGPGLCGLFPARSGRCF